MIFHLDRTLAKPRFILYAYLPVADFYYAGRMFAADKKSALEFN